MSNASEKPGDHGMEHGAHAADRRWTVLFIGDHGKVIAFKRIKTLAFLTIAALVTALITVVVLVSVNQGLHGRARELQQRLESSHQQIQALRQERDLLTAHVVLVETKMRETLAEAGRSAADRKTRPADPEPVGDRPASPAQAGAGDTDKGPAGAPSAAPAKRPLDRDEAVALEGFRAKFDEGRNAFEVEYKLAATNPGRKPLAGHVIVVFKGEDLEPEQWLAMPRVELPRGRPSGIQKGYTFSISHSKAFSRSMPAPKSFPTFTMAVVYVFSPEGQLLLARDYAVQLQSPGG
jgi:cell division protein FtsB